MSRALDILSLLLTLAQLVMLLHLYRLIKKS